MVKKRQLSPPAAEPPCPPIAPARGLDDESWGRVLAAFEAESGDPPAASPEAWELCLLARLVGKELGAPARKLEAKLLEACEGATLESCAAFVRECFPPPSPPPSSAAASAHLRTVSELLAARSVDSELLARLHEEVAAAWVLAPCAEVAAAVSKVRLAAAAYFAGAAPEQAAGAAPPLRRLHALASFGPPAFFPVGNAAGRHNPITRGLRSSSPRLLFVGLSDPRHVFAALLDLEPDQGARVACVCNDLNAVTNARTAIIIALLRGRSGRRDAATSGLEGWALADRVLASFMFWWMHELPLCILPALAAAAEEAKAYVCEETTAVLCRWLARWQHAGAEDRVVSQDIADMVKSPDAGGMLDGVSDSMLNDLRGQDTLVVANCTFQHPARLDYSLYRGRPLCPGRMEAGDGLLLWPEPEEEFSTDSGQPERSEYLRSLRKNFPAYREAVTTVAKTWLEGEGRFSCNFISCDCLALPQRLPASASAPARFHRVFTSNVADHVGLPALALSLGPLLERDDGSAGSCMNVCLSNNLRVVDPHGDIASLVPRLYGVELPQICGMAGLRPGRVICGAEHKDQIDLIPEPSASAVDVSEWLAESVKRMHRCPPANADTLRLRRAAGDIPGMAARYARRFTVSPVTTSIMAHVLAKVGPEQAEAAALALQGASPVAMEVAMLADRQRLAPELLALLPRTGMCGTRTYEFTVPRGDAREWALRVQPRVVLLWVRAAGLVSAGRALAVPREPVWRRCLTRASLGFLKDGAWGPLRWALTHGTGEGPASEAPVQLLHRVEIACADGDFRVQFELPRVEVDFGAGSAAFLLSVVDCALIYGPVEADKLRAAGDPVR